MLLPTIVIVLIVGIGGGLFYYINNYKYKSSFYYRLKKKSTYKNKAPYSLTNVRMENNSTLIGDLLCTSKIYKFLFEFTNLHFKITNSNRFEVKDVIVVNDGDEKDAEPFVEILDNKTTVKFKRVEIKIFYNPLQIEIKEMIGGKKILKINPKDNMVIDDTLQSNGISLGFYFPKCLKVYGLPQRAMRLALTVPEIYRFYNNDRFGYRAFDPHPLYGTIPILYAFSPLNTVGLYWLNASDTYIELENSENKRLEAQFYSESGAMEFYVLPGPDLSHCVKDFTKLTGVAPLPPYFSLGYHQSRYSYQSQNDVQQVSNKFIEHGIPLDVLYMDIDCTDNKKYFTWDPKTFPNPELLIEDLSQSGHKAVVIIDPHVKVDNDYFIYKTCNTNGFLVKNENGENFIADCWPGTSAWIDFFNPKARKYYSQIIEERINPLIGLYLWNDMNEPAIFNMELKTMPKNTIHYPNWQHKDVHNQYGYYQNMATYEGLKKRGTRPFVLTRSHFAGTQRYAAVWSGDNVATWDHLKVSLPMALTLSLVGISFNGADIGGFVKHPEEELLIRWYQLGAWLPYFRGHSNDNTPRREPYLFPIQTQKRIKEAIENRYYHLPYWYNIFYVHYLNAEPVIYPLVYKYPKDPNTWNIDFEFFVGSEILVCPVLNKGVSSMTVYLPGRNNIWYLQDGDCFEGATFHKIKVNLNGIPVFYKGGSIIPVRELNRTKTTTSLATPSNDNNKSTSFIDNNPLTLLIFLDENEVALGCFYDDDHETFNYQKNINIFVIFNFLGGEMFTTIDNFKLDKDVYLNKMKIFGMKSSFQQVIVNGTPLAFNCFNKNENYILLDNLQLNIKHQFEIKFE